MDQPPFLYYNKKFKDLTHKIDEDENLIVGFRGSEVKEKRPSFEVFEPMHTRNLRLSKKYFANQHKNKSNFNVYKDYLKNMSEFERSKQVNTQPGKCLS